MSEAPSTTSAEIVVDLDGPILDVARRHFKVYSDIATELGCARLSFEAYWAQKRLPLGLKRILELTVPRPPYEAFTHRWLQEIERDIYLDIDTLQPGALRTLDRWNDSGHKVVLATMRQDAEALDRQLLALGLRSRFRAVVVCDRLAGAIGKAESVAVAIGDAPADSYWIGDTEVDVTAARRRGSIAWALSCGLRAAAFLKTQRPDHLSEYLADVDLKDG
jgi:phosphoglycolate phosphatase-like HAD superfamily hydrolase